MEYVLGKTKRHFPLVMRKKLPNFDKLQKTCLDIISRVDEDFMPDVSAKAEKIMSDKDFFKKYDSDKPFQLDQGDGSNFVKSNQAIYGNYSVVAFQEMSYELSILSDTWPTEPSSSPLARQRGMKSLQAPDYHPKYDERSYTKFTPFATPEVQEFLTDFGGVEQTCRSSLVKLDPHMYLTPHFDMGPEFASRFQIPIVATKGMEMGFRENKNKKWKVWQFEEGYAYFVNTGFEHYVRNEDDKTRYQVRVCVIGQNVLNDFESVQHDYDKENW